MYEYIHKKQRGYKYHCRGQERRNISFFTIQEQTIMTVWVCVLRLRVTLPPSTLSSGDTEDGRQFDPFYVIQICITNVKSPSWWTAHGYDG